MLISLEVTNSCNLKCLHCMRDKLEDRRSIALDVVQKVLREAKAYGLERHIALTGGEPTLHPHLEELIELIVEEGFRFQIVTNGFQFRSKVLPILLRPHIRKQLHHVTISLDGASARTHDANRGEGAFQATMEQVALCKLKGIPLYFITVINNFNKTELADIALLGAGLEGICHMFGPLHVTPLSVQKSLSPSPEETRKLLSFVGHTLAPALKTPILVAPGAYCQSAMVQCIVFRGEQLHVDFQGNALFCCTLSHPADDSKPDEPGEDVLADLKRESLKAAIVRQKLMAARLTEERLAATDSGILADLDYFPCHWCFKRFGKLGWLRNYPASPWAEPQLEGQTSRGPSLDAEAGSGSGRKGTTCQ